METIDLSKDEFFMRNHLGQMECKLCLTLHPTEGLSFIILTCSHPTLAFHLRRSPFTVPKVPTLPIHRASVIRRT